MLVATITAPMVLCGPKCANFAFIYAFLWGIGFGGFYCTNTALFVTLIPPESEAQFMSLSGPHDCRERGVAQAFLPKSGHSEAVSGTSWLLLVAFLFGNGI